MCRKLPSRLFIVDAERGAAMDSISTGDATDARRKWSNESKKPSLSNKSCAQGKYGTLVALHFAGLAPQRDFWRSYMDIFQDPTLQAIGPYMSRLSKRQQIVASNLANIDTPGYKTQDVSFHATIQELLNETPTPLRARRAGHVPGSLAGSSTVQPYEVTGLTSRMDRNNVDLDRELMKLSETSFGYSMMAEILKGKFRTLAISINEGGTR
jgi:flagellar basal-body rod protein FlgB